jgi:hypothetical protein
MEDTDTHTPVENVEEAKAVTRAKARDFRDLVAKYLRRHLPSSESKSKAVEAPPRQEGVYGNLILMLRVILSIWLCAEFGGTDSGAFREWSDRVLYELVGYHHALQSA